MDLLFMKFKKKTHKTAKLQSLELQNFGFFQFENELGGQGKNHTIFVGILLFLYGIILTLSLLFHPLILMGAAMIYFYTKNPFKFKFYKYIEWFWQPNSPKEYHYHKRFSVGGLDIYILDNYIFAPGQSLQAEIKHAFESAEKHINSISA